MAVPRVFISSTCYDLKYIRENLKYFISNMGYESILSEDGDVYYDPREHTHDACISEVGNCQLFVLIIGGRYGGKYLKSDKSITNREYEEAIKQKIPVFTLVERSVLSEHFVYQKNKDKSSDILYPSVDDVKIFGFIDEVRKNSTNNAIHPFSDYRDIESYLKKQWAGMMFSFLANQIENRKVSELFEEIHQATEKIEYYTKQVAIQVGNKQTKTLLKCYEAMLGCTAIQDLRNCWGINISPFTVVRCETIDDICQKHIKVDPPDDESNSITYGGPPYCCSKARYDVMSSRYTGIRATLIDIVKDNDYTVEQFLELEGKTAI